MGFSGSAWSPAPLSRHHPSRRDRRHTDATQKFSPKTEGFALTTSPWTHWRQ
ncbi:MAG: hypothetical protein NZT92_03210 [Abditibacteriales bacterium]|nr:hypothetical protein [Abditibacteriales bacterium]